MFNTGRLSVCPQEMVEPGPTGESQLHLSPRRDTRLYAPAAAAARRPLPLLVMLHGAGGEARQGLDLLRPWAEEAGIILLAPASRRPTWDIILSTYGPDVEMIDRSLKAVFRGYPIDSARIGLGGFSDGASYALSIGLGNGDLFTHILAFSPGFVAVNAGVGKPRIFISHGVNDTVLSIDHCSRRIVPKLKRAGYQVDYREFQDGHTVPPEIARAALARLIA